MNKYEKLFKEITGKDFERYYNENKQSITCYISRFYTKDMDKAEDFTNQAFMQSLEKIETYNKDKSIFKTWLTKIAINLVIKDWKDSHKYNFISLERDTSETPGIINVLKLDDGYDTSEYDNENKKKCEIIYDVIENLPDKYKKVMVMRELNHMPYKDIADTIKKETNINISEDKMKLENPEDFFSLSLTNNGNENLKINFKSNVSDNIYELNINSSCSVTINRDDITWERSISDEFIIDSSYTTCTGLYVSTTNLSTIKSQIKKARELIQKKVKKRFELINKNGIENFSI